MMIDYIFSNKLKKIVATIEFEKDSNIEYFYRGSIIQFNFPTELYDLIMESDDIIRQVAISFLDEVEEKIQEYDLRLKESNERIFCVVIKNKTYISFYIKYPTSRGFLDEYPD